MNQVMAIDMEKWENKRKQESRHGRKEILAKKNEKFGKRTVESTAKAFNLKKHEALSDKMKPKVK